MNRRRFLKNCALSVGGFSLAGCAESMSLRQALPNTFLNIRLDPVQIVEQSEDQIRDTIVKLVQDAGDPLLTGVCCVNMDNKVSDDQVTAILKTVTDLRKKFCKDQL